MAGVKETKELIGAGFAFAGLLASEFKDGIQGQDFVDIFSKLLNDEAFQKKLIDGVSGIQEVPAEVGDISVFEGIELGRFVFDEIQKLGEKLK